MLGGYLLALAPVGRAMADNPATSPQTPLSQKAAKAKQGYEDPVTYLLGFVAAIAFKQSATGFTTAWTQWKELLKKAKEDAQRLRAGRDSAVADAANDQRLTTVYNEEVVPAVKNIFEFASQLKWLRNKRMEQMSSLERRLGGQVHFNSIEEMEKWLKRTEEGRGVEKKYPSWYREYRSLRADEKKLLENLREEFNKLVVHGNDIMPHDDYARIEIQSNGTRRMVFYNGLTPTFVSPPELPGLATKMQKDCEASMVQVSGTRDARWKQLHADAAALRDTRRAAGPRYALQLIGPTAWGAVTLGTSIPSILKATNYWGDATLPPPPPIEKELVTAEGRKAMEPFTLLAKRLLKKHRPAIQKNIELNLEPQEVAAIGLSELTLEDRVSVLDSATDLDIVEVRTAMNKALKAYAEQNVEEGDKFASILKLLNFKDFESLSPKEQTSKVRAVHDFLTAFYATTFDVSLKGVRQGPTSQRITGEVIEPLITETIDELKTMEWKVVRRPSDPAPVPPPASSPSASTNKAPDESNVESTKNSEGGLKGSEPLKQGPGVLAPAKESIGMNIPSKLPAPILTDHNAMAAGAPTLGSPLGPAN